MIFYRENVTMYPRKEGGQRMQGLSFGERLALIRRRRGLTQTELAARLGCSQTDIHRMETGVVQDPHMSRLMALAQALGISMDWLAGFKDDDLAIPPPETPAKRSRSRKAAPVA